MTDTGKNPIWKGGIAFSKEKKALDLTIGDDKTFDSRLYRYEILSLTAYHLALAEISLLDREVSKQILNTLADLYNKEPSEIGQSEDVHSFVEESFLKRNENAGKYLRTLLSRNEQSHTDIRLFSIDSLLKIKISILEACLKISSVKTDPSMIMPGFTHYRQSMPVAWRTYLDHVSSTLLEEAMRISAVIDGLRELPLGYGSGFGNDLNINWQHVADSLGLKKSNANPFYVASFRGLDEMRILDLLKEITIRLSRIAQDLIMWSSDDAGFLDLPMEFVTGSSLMPNKKNPDFLEMLEGYANQVLSDSIFTSIEILSKSSGYYRDFQISKWKVMTSLDVVNKMIRNFGDLMSGIKFDIRRAKKILLNSSYATGYSANLVKEGIPWKDSYSRIGEMIIKGEKIPEYNVKEYSNNIEKFALVELENTKQELNERVETYSRLIKKAADF